MEICAGNVLEKFGVNTGVEIKTTSTLPVASGLSSSSAVSNASHCSFNQALSDEYHVDAQKIGLDDIGILSHN